MGDRGRWISEFKANLTYIVRSGIIRATQPKQTKRNKYTEKLVVGTRSVVVCLPGMCEALCSIPRTEKKNEYLRKNRTPCNLPKIAVHLILGLERWLNS